MKTMILMYNDNGSYTIKIDNWTLTGPLSFLSDVMDECYTPGWFIGVIQNIINNG